ncbi:porin family protein [Bizionia sp.]|uniref:porin family protein n=1 Tax=Bizionia sp. TaxID=1954480 RepID=UPI003A95592B
MKKLLVCAVVAVFSIGSLSAQDVRFGVKGGLNLANLVGDFGIYDGYYGVDDPEMKVGFHIGGVAEVKFSEKFAVQPELLFSNQGYKSKYDFAGAKADYKVNLNYINLPIMVKFFPIDGLSIEAGPQVGFLIAAKDELNDYEISIDPEDPDNVDTSDKYKSIDFGMNIGAGYELPSGLFFAARYNIGISKVDDVDDGLTGIFSGSLSRKNRVFQLSAGFMF